MGCRPQSHGVETSVPAESPDAGALEVPTSCGSTEVTLPSGSGHVFLHFVSVD